MTDTQFRALLKHDKRTAHRALFDEYLGYVYSIVYRRLPGSSREDVEECVSDVFADVFLCYDTDSVHSGDLRGLIGAVAGRRAVDTYRKLRRIEGKTVPMDALAEQAADVDIPAHAEAVERSRILLQCIEALGEPDATIIMQRFYFGIPAGEIAQSVGLSAAAVRMRCSRAVKRLKALLAAHGITGTEGLE